MGKLARILRPGDPSDAIVTTGRRARTAEGGRGWVRDTKGELFLLAVTNMVAERTFYETGEERDDRFVELLHRAVADDPGWVARFVPWLRTTANMRSASVVAAAEYARALATLPPERRAQAPTVRSVVAGALRRADEPGDFCAYWFAGRRPARNSLPGGVQRGVADAVARLYTERAVVKYDGLGQSWRLGDVVELARPRPAAPWQSSLFRYLLDRRHHSDAVAGPDLPVLAARAAFEAIPTGERAVMLRRWGEFAHTRLAEAGMTWEALSGWLGGPLDAAAWSAQIPTMGLMAQVRNLRSFDEAGVPDDVAGQVAVRLADEEQVRASRLFPLRFLSAYRTAPSDRWLWPLEQAVSHSLSNVPALPGRTLVLLDCSGSMQSRLSARSHLRRCEAAALFGLALARRAERADVVRYGSGHEPVRLARGATLLRQVDAVGRPDMGGTNTFGTLAATYRPGVHDRVVILTDEQHGGSWHGGAEPDEVLRSVRVPVITFNLAGHRVAQAPSGPDRVTAGGLTDAAFTMLAVLDEQGRTGWPF